MVGRTSSASGWRPLRRPARLGSPTPFGRLALTHALSMGGDALVTMALAGSLFFSISPSAARGRVALSLLFTMAPFAVVAPFLGPAIDRTRSGRRRMVVLACAGRVLAAVVMARVVHDLLLFPAAFAALVLSKTYVVAKASLVPSAVTSPAELVEANAKLAVNAAVAGLAAAIPGIPLLHFAGAAWVLRLAAVVYLAGAVTAVRLVERPAADEAGHPSAEGDAGQAEVARAGRQTSIVLASVVMALLRAQVGFVTFLIAFSFRRGGAPSWWFGIVLAASIGAGLAGAVVAPIVRTHVKEEWMIVACIALVAVVGLATAPAHGRVWAVVMAATIGLAAAAGKLGFDSMVQRDSPLSVRGRAFARFETGFQLVWVAGGLVPVVLTITLRQGFAIIGLGALGGLVAYLLAVRAISQAG